MKLKDILTPSFKTLMGAIHRSPNLSVVEACRADDSDFCREVVASGCLTQEQMAHAAARYQLGKSRSGRCIFWMIDESGIVRDGHIGDSWASVMLKNREPELLKDWHVKHCLFGLHTLPRLTGAYCHPSQGEGRAVCVVEKEPSAVILSELFPDCIWLASVYPMNLNVFSFKCLQGYQVMLFPSTDETMDTYLFWLETAQQIRRSYPIDMTVSSVLEDHATPEQKAARIDLAGFIGASLVKREQQAGE